MALPDDPHWNPSGIVDRKRSIPVAGGAAGTHTLAEISAGDFIVSVHSVQDAGAGVTDLTAEFVNPVAADGLIDNTGGTASTGETMQVVFIDKDWGELVNADWIG